jgi:NADPH:quinone reductase-like Zn-dependent oxidoreductase
MKTVQFDALGSRPTLRDVPDPTPRDGQVLVRVAASSVNPVDNAIAAGMLKGMVDHAFPVTLGRDYAGIVEEVGDGVEGFEPGDEVFGFVPGMAPRVGSGAWAELLTLPTDVSIAHKPVHVDMAAAGAAPVAAITALTAIDMLSLRPGDVVLVVGAPGGVGSVACQLAVELGASVIAPALPEDEHYLRALGVEELVARNGDLVAAVHERHPDGVDALLDLVSHGPGVYDDALKPHARVASPLGAAGEGPHRVNVMAAPSTENLMRLADLLDRRALRIPIQETYPLERFADGMHALANEHTQGKIAIEVA